MSPAHPTTRTIAQAAGVCSATVSLALRNHPSISAATKARIQRIARKQGYHPDPVAARLMVHIRNRPSARPHATICALSDHPASLTDSYVKTIAAAAEARAKSMGYIYQRLYLQDFQDNPRRLGRLLAAQGVDGLLLLPMIRLQALDGLLDWSDYSAVSTSYSVLSPAFHRVVPDQFSNLMLACNRLVARGYRRIGFITTTANDVRVHHHFSAVIAWHNQFGGVDSIAPLIQDGEKTEHDLSAWIQAQRPDAVVAWDETDFLAVTAKLKLRVPEDIAVVSFTPVPGIKAGIYQRPEVIGSTAVEILADLIQRGEKGVSKFSKVTMIEGCWQRGRSVSERRKPSTSGRRPV